MLRIGPTGAAVGTAVLAVAISSTIDATVKWAAVGGGVALLLAWRFLFGAAIAFVCWLKWAPSDITRSSFGFHALRGLLQLGSVGLYFYSLTKIPLAIATIIGFSSVLFITPVALIVLKERPSNTELLAVLFGLIGVAVMMVDWGNPDAHISALDPGGVAAGLAAGLATALLLVLLRLRSRKEHPLTISLFTNAVPAFYLLPVTFGLFGLPNIQQLAVYAALGLMGFAVWYLLTVAYSKMAASRLAPTELLGAVFAALFGFFIFGELPDFQAALGAGLIVISCVLVFAIKQRRSLRLAR